MGKRATPSCNNSSVYILIQRAKCIFHDLVYLTYFLTATGHYGIIEQNSPSIMYDTIDLLQGHNIEIRVHHNISYIPNKYINILS